MQALFVEFYNTGCNSRLGQTFYVFSSDEELECIKKQIASRRKYGDYENYSIFEYDDMCEMWNTRFHLVDVDKQKETC